MPKRIQTPGGPVDFPDTMQDSEIESVLQRQYGAPQPQQSQHPVLDAVTDFGKGMYKGAGSTVANLNNLVSSIPGVGRVLSTPTNQLLSGHISTPQQIEANRQQLVRGTTPTNTAQSIGKGLEQAGEFLIPGAGEEAAAARLGGGLLARVGTKAIGSALVNKAQGGSLAAGAAFGAAGEGIASAAKAVAPTVARVAMGVRGVDGARAATDPGLAILNRTTGYSPGKVAAEAAGLNSADTSALNHAARGSSVPVDLQPARDAAQGFVDTAVRRGNADTINEVQKLSDQLHANPVTGPIPRQVPAFNALEMKRGIGDFKGSWNPAASHDLADSAVAATYSAMHPGLESAIPGYSAINDRLSAMIPVAQRSAAKDLNAGVIERTLGRFARPTGALLGAAAGATEGRREGGTPGMIAGGVAGLVAPEILANPTTLMMGARAAYNPALGRYVLPAARGLAAQTTRNGDGQ